MENDNKKRACKKCIGDKHIYNSLKNDYGKLSLCSYCGDRKKTIAIQDIANEICDSIETEYSTCDMEYFNPKTNEYDIPNESTSDLLCCLFPGDRDLFNDICAVIDPGNNLGWYSRDNKYFGKDVNINKKYISLWNTFCNMVKHETRYVFFRQKDEDADDNRPDILDCIGDAADKIGLIKEFEPDCSFFRGRLHIKKEDAFSSDIDLAAPPDKYAKVNRMSAEGISIFYGANNIKTALSEIFDYNYKYATVVQFTNINTMHLLDLSNINSIEYPSIYDHRNRFKRKYIDFFKNFSESIARPIDNSPAIEYVPTQILTEYFRHVFQYGCFVDGIIYSSSKNHNGKCYALFANHDECLSTHEHQKLLMKNDTLQTYKITFDIKYQTEI